MLFRSDLSQMGLEIKTFTIRDINDDNGYLEALGKKRIAEVKRDAEIAEAEATKDARVRTAVATRDGEQARILAETEIAESNRNKELKVQAYKGAQETEKAKADLAYLVQQSKVEQEVESERMQVQIVKKQKEIELAGQEALRREKELDATVRKSAEADRYRQQQESEALHFREIQRAQAEGRAIEIKGEAEAKAIRAIGEAEAEAMRLKAEAFKQYNEAAVTQMIIERLPELARAISEPLSKTEKIVIVDSGSGNGRGAAKVTDYVSQILATLPETVKSLTGVDLLDMLPRKAAEKDSSEG